LDKKTGQITFPVPIPGKEPSMEIKIKFISLFSYPYLYQPRVSAAIQATLFFP
jgi:hypothetical protein